MAVGQFESLTLISFCFCFFRLFYRCIEGKKGGQRWCGYVPWSAVRQHLSQISPCTFLFIYFKYLCRLQYLGLISCREHFELFSPDTARCFIIAHSKVSVFVCHCSQTKKRETLFWTHSYSPPAFRLSETPLRPLAS